MKRISKVLSERIANAKWVCGECGCAYGRSAVGHFSTWHNGECDVCGKQIAVTQTRDYNYLRK